MTKASQSVDISRSYIPSNCVDRYQNLYPYQRGSVLWMLQEFEKSSICCSQAKDNPQLTPEFRMFQAHKGVLIGHSPGLGKTPITCLTLSALFSTNSIRYVLLIVPKTVIEQWRSHINVWCPNATVCLYSGSPTKRAQDLQNLIQSKKGIVLTTYRTADLDAQILERVLRVNSQNQHNAAIQNQTKLDQIKSQQVVVQQRKNEMKDNFVSFSSSSEDLSIKTDSTLVAIANRVPPFRQCAFDVMVLDEATEIKNEASQTHQSLKTISCFFKIALTGTPIMNNIKEMYNLINFLHQGFLGPRSVFVNEYDKKINLARLEDASECQKIVGKVLQRYLIDAIKPIFLRHTKEQVKAMDTEKTEIILWMNLSNIQEKLYDELTADKNFKNILNHQIESKLMPFHLISILRKLCENMMRINLRERSILSKELETQIAEEQKKYVLAIGSRMNVIQLQHDSDDSDDDREEKLQQQYQLQGQNVTLKSIDSLNQDLSRSGELFVDDNKSRRAWSEPPGCLKSDNLLAALEPSNRGVGSGACLQDRAEERRGGVQADSAEHDRGEVGGAAVPQDPSGGSGHAGPEREDKGEGRRHRGAVPAAAVALRLYDEAAEGRGDRRQDHRAQRPGGRARGAQEQGERGDRDELQGGVPGAG